MRWSIASIVFVAISFIFFVMYAILSKLLFEVRTALETICGFNDAILSSLQNAFMIFGIIFFVVGIVLTFVADSLSDEPELYWRS